MECEKIRELLLTDYLDKEADITVRTRVQKHLEACSACKRFEEEVRRTAVEPFRNAVKPQVPVSIWYAVREAIGQRQSRAPGMLDAIKERLKVFYAPGPALAFASTAAVALIVFGLITNYTMDRNRLKDYFAQQMAFYATLNNGEENPSYAGENDASLEENMF